MRNVIVGMIVGGVIGVVAGAMVVAPRLAQPGATPAAGGKSDSPVATTPSQPTSERTPTPDKTLHWRMSAAYASSVPHLGSLGKRVERQIWRVSAGSFEIKHHEPGTLALPADLFGAVASGAVETGFASPAMWESRSPALQLFGSLPFGPPAEEYLAWFYHGGGRQMMEDLYHKQGLHSLLCGLAPPAAAGWFRKEIRTVEDFKGLRMRISGLGAKVVERLGAVPRDMGEGDIFAAVEAGKLDGIAFATPGIDIKLGFHEMLKYYYFPGWQQPTTFLDLMINLDKWNSLPTPVRDQLEAVCGDNVRQGLTEGEALQFAALREIQGKGVRLKRLPIEVLEALSKAWKKVASDEASSSVEFRRVWKSLSAFRKDHSIWRELARP